jgi:tetratricopeptide (TPR) repeat protein
MVPASDAAVQVAQAHQREGRLGEAAVAFERALQFDRRRLDAWTGLAACLISLQRFHEAEAACREALALSPYDPVAVRTFSALLQLQARHATALTFAIDVTTAHPAHGEGWMARGDSLANMGRQDEALACYEVLRDDPAFAPDALVRIGMMQGALGRVAAAIAAFDAAVALSPQAAAPRFQRGLMRLAQKDFTGGWDDYEARWRSERFVNGARGIVPKPVVPLLATNLSAASLAGHRVMLIGEQGVGDQLMFASMIPDLSTVAASIDCVCDPRLVRLFSASFGGVSVVEPRAAKIDTDVLDTIAAIGSLGGAFRRHVGDFPGSPYLRPRPEVVDRWAARLGQRRQGLRIGLSWRGGTPATRGSARSLSFDQLEPVLNLPGCEFISLQYGDVTEELASANRGRANPVRSFTAAEIGDFEDLAALVANLDVVVSVQTALVHLAGAIGQTCLTLIPHTPEWRYGASGSSMPWYRSVRLYRQAEPGAWDGVVADVAAALTALGAGKTRSTSI